MKIKEYVVAALTVASVLGLSFTQIEAADAADAGKKYEANWESLNSRPTPQWFSDAKFGIFIHWGIYAVPGWAPKGQYSEWYWNWMSNKDDKNPSWAFHRDHFGKDFSYKDFAPMFKAQLYDPAFWADLFVKSGAKY
ncbi:MAG: alpha-L-fucosidase, partial [Verrucomicrobia bacterium]|nr:alpha-L-fucosidase [Verrucomicrobiota bacterium]